MPQILQNNGYYTGLIGKYHISGNPQPGFDYWMEYHLNDYTNIKFNVNGTVKLISGHATDIVSDSAISFFHKVPEGKPFFLWLGYRAPHITAEPRPQDEGLFDDFDMPFPGNFKEYKENVPEFLYDCHTGRDSVYIDDYYRGYYEMLNGVESTLGDIFSELDTLGLMDSTLIIFMSDNGYMMGEHVLREKQLAYEESIRIPIFMRYPPLIEAGTQVNEQIAMNLDIAPTILDFAGIEDTFGMQGISLLKLLNNSVTRTEMMYEFFNEDCVPDIRAVRSLDYKYVQYNCSEATEEFFDLNNDPHENTNLVNNASFATLIQDYRDKLTFWRNYYLDLTWDSLYECHLSNPQRLTQQGEGKPLTLLNLFPNPASNSIQIHFISSENTTGSLQIINVLGKIVHEEIFEYPGTGFSKSIPLDNLQAGTYFAVIRHGLNTYRQAFVKQ
jgi:N-acetylglucosamine-6-sulfatase